ncbi:MAG: hypothetical protein JWO09_1722 [Bacteroidetes bacterium]|nr:hypothetical protein [Bacteroidota bacterium]
MKHLSLKAGACILMLGAAIGLQAQNPWTPSVTNGFGNSYNSTVFGMNVFNGQLYAAVGTDSGYVYRSPNGNPGSWTKVFSDPLSRSVEAITSSSVGGGNMYIAANAGFPDSSRVMRSVDGTSWSTYFTSSSAKITHIIPFKGLGSADSIYVVENNGLVHKSYYNSNDPLNLSAAWDTVFDANLFASGSMVTAIGKHGSKLYLGGPDAQLFSSADGNTWTANPNVGNGFGDANNQSVTAIGSFGGEIYVAMQNNYIGAQLWKSADEISWTMVQQFDGAHAYVSSLTVADGKLWVTVASNLDGGLITYTGDGVNFTVSDDGGFGDAGYNGYNASVLQFGNNVYWGGEYYGMFKRFPLITQGASVWRTCTVTPPAINAGPDQTVCQGISVTLDAGSGNAYNSWSTGDTTQMISVSTPGTYTLTAVGANGCTNTDNVRVFNNPAPTVLPPNGGGTICAGTSVPLFPLAVSNYYIADPPIHTTTNDSISDLIGGDVYDTINVSGLSAACSCDALMSVTIDSLYHTFSADLDIGIYAPDGSYITLSQSNGGGAGNTYFGTEFILNATESIMSANTPYTGSYVPMGDFHSLSGTPNGNWVLRVQDHVGGDNGTLKGWTIRFKVDDTTMTFSWTPATGLSSTTTLNTIATPLVPTTYMLTATNAIGCSTTTPIPVDVADLAFAQAVDTVCYGSSITLNVIGGTASTTWSPTTDLDVSTGPTVVASPSASTVYYVVDTIAGCPVMDSIHLYANAQLFLTAPSPVTICNNDTATFTATANGGSAPYTYAWDMGGTYLYGQTIQPVLTGGTSYTLTATDIAGCTVNGGSTSAFVVPSTDIYGHVSYSGGSVNNSAVVLYRYEPFLTLFDTVQTTFTDASGDYFFPSVDHNNYLIEVFPAASYTTLVPTYYGNAYLWDSAAFASHDCAMNDTFNIVTVEETGLTGPGFLQGSILEDIGFGRVPGDPVPGVDVKLGRNPGGQLVASTQTNGSGTYTFAGVPYDSYIIYADIPGLGRDSSYTITVDASHDTYTDLDYLVNDTVIFIVPNTTTGITTPGSTSAAASTFSVFPNPSNGNAAIEYSIVDDATVSLGIYNVLGVKVIGLVSTKQMPGVYHYSISREKNQLKPGVYFVTLITNGKTDIHRLVISE